MSTENGSFDLVLVCGPQTEAGRVIGNEEEVIGVISKCLFLAGQSPLRDAAFGATNNLARALSSTNDDGSLNFLGAPGLVSLQFRGREVADYFAAGAGERVLAAWAGDVPGGHLDGLLQDACNRHRLHDLDSFMSFVYRPAAGEETLGDFAAEAGQLLRSQRVKAKDVAPQLERLQQGFRQRLTRVVAGSECRAGFATTGLGSDISDQAIATIDRDGPRSALQLLTRALEHLGTLRDALAGQRDDIARDVAKAEGVMASASAALQSAASRSRTGRLAGIGKPLNVYLSSAKQLFQARHGLEVTTIALAALSGARETLGEIERRVRDLCASMRVAASLCRRQRKALESAPWTPVSEMIDRPLYGDEDLKALYEWSAGAPWPELTGEAQKVIRDAIGGLSALLDADGEGIAVGFQAACRPVFDRVRNMTADGFVRWRRDALGTDPALIIRDAAALASVLASFDRTVTMSDEYDEGTLTILGVTSAEDSVFAATPMITLVSTGDPESISYLVLKLGYPARTLYHYPEYAEANARIARQGLICHNIYPGFPPPEKRSGKS